MKSNMTFEQFCEIEPQLRHLEMEAKSIQAMYVSDGFTTGFDLILNFFVCLNFDLIQTSVFSAQTVVCMCH